jgi:cytoskeletal protein CcmA (bactofilin family)
MAAKNEVQLNSTIGEGSIFEGRFFINGSLQIDGRFVGEIKTKEQVIIGELGKVKTDITAKRVVIGGTLIGNIEAEEEVMLLSTGRVLGNIRTPRVRIEEGVVVQGQISINAGQKKGISSIIEESFNTGPKLEGMMSAEPEMKVKEKVAAKDV